MLRDLTTEYKHTLYSSATVLTMKMQPYLTLNTINQKSESITVESAGSSWLVKKMSGIQTNNISRLI